MKNRKREYLDNDEQKFSGSFDDSRVKSEQQLYNVRQEGRFGQLALGRRNRAHDASVLISEMLFYPRELFEIV